MNNAPFAQLPHDSYGPALLPQPFPWIMIVVSSAFLIAVAFLVVYLLKQREKVPPLTLSEQALRQLYALRKDKTPENASLWISKASHILRRYIEQRFSLPATYQTTEEFFHGQILQAVELQDKSMKKGLRHCLELSDLVKFACFQPDSAQLDEIELAIEQCIRIKEIAETEQGQKRQGETV